MIISNRVMKLDLYDKAKQLSDKNFKQIIGVEKKTFDEMVMILDFLGN